MLAPLVQYYTQCRTQKELSTKPAKLAKSSQVKARQGEARLDEQEQEQEEEQWQKQARPRLG